MSERSHWERIYGEKDSAELSWYQHRAERSLALIRDSGVTAEAPIIDVGGGASRLAADLLQEGFRELWVLDISAAALDRARAALGPDASRIRWVESDVTEAALPAAHFALWHDRAVFHFLTDPADRAAYVDTLRTALRPGGDAIIATFAEDGPERCSGLPVMRYDAATLMAQFGGGFELLHTEKESHRTPAGAVQSFRYCRLRYHNR